MARSSYDELRRQQAAMDTPRPKQSGYAELKSQQAAMDTPRPKQSGYAELKSQQAAMDPPSASPSGGRSDFGRAFAAARMQGAKEFTWNGKRYNTKVK